MWIKICANTSIEDALAAVAQGADALGFVFALSARRVTVEQVRPITSALPPQVERVGVFTHEDPQQIVAIASEAQLTAVQLHGGIDTALTEQLRRQLDPATGIIQTTAWRIDQPGAREQVLEELATVTREGLADRVLIDARIGQRSGGLGLRFNWSEAVTVFASQPRLKLIVAGGLRPENVGEAIETLSPWGVDVASGVEQEPRTKDPAKLRAFIENARRAGVVAHAGR